MMVRGLKVVYILLLTGKALSHTITKFSSSIITLFGMRLKGNLILMDHALYFLTRICLSISGTCLLVAVGLIFNPGK